MARLHGAGVDLDGDASLIVAQVALVLPGREVRDLGGHLKWRSP
jgi:hypothetical protein